MTGRTVNRSTLHLMMGQETIYLLLTISVFIAVVLAVYIAKQHRPFEDPPIITLRESDGFHFQTGSADISEAFQTKLRDGIAPVLRTNADKYGANVVEVIGHTDEVPLRTHGGGNLDKSLVAFLAGSSNLAPVANDNVGLGMARATAVARALRATTAVRELTIVPLSAGEFLKPDDTVTDGSSGGADESRRRIEIRLRRRERH